MSVLGGVVGIFVQVVEGVLQQLDRGWNQAAVTVLRDTILLPYTLNSTVFTIWSFARGVAMGGLTAVLVYAALRSMLFSLHQQAGDVREWLPRLVMGVVWINGSYFLVQTLLELNNAFVATVLAHISQQTMHNFFAMTIAGGLMLLLINIIIIFAVLYLAVSYFLRAAEIVLLLTLLPFLGALWILEDWAGLWRAAVAELLATIFLQSGQVLVLWLFIALGMAQRNGTAGTTLVNYLSSLACFFLMAKVPGMLRNLFGSAGVFGGRDFGREGSLAALGARVLLALGLGAGA